MSTDWDRLIENHFAKKKGNKLNMLLETVREVMGEFSAEDDFLLTEAEEKGKSRTYTIKQIPMIPISELGWADNSNDQGGTQRSLLEDWLRNIEGGSFQQKLDNVQAKMAEGFRDIPSGHNDVQKYIQEVMSYLVFYKTLTMAITNFNAAAAGFNFEAFLATLMNGSQIPASGANTIADFTADIDGETVPVSLKLYTAGQLEVGGSFTDLVNDMNSPNPSWASWASRPEYEGGAMKYVVCTKLFEKTDDPLARKGVINFYEFDISRANIFRILGTASKAGKECIASSRDFMIALSEWDKTKQGNVPDINSTLPAKKDKGSPAAAATGFVNYLIKDYSDKLEQASDYTPEQIHNLFRKIGEIYLTRIESKGFGAGPATYLGTKTVLRAAIIDEFGLNKGDGFVDEVYNEVLSYYRVYYTQEIKASDKRGEAIGKIGWMYGRDPALTEWYESLSPESKTIALRNTKGYLTTDHWKIPNKKAIGYGGGSPFAVLPIGAPYVQELLAKVQNEVMDEVFQIFDRMAEMSDKLNSFFANGLKQKGEAEMGAAAGEEAAAGAREFAK